MNRTSLKTYAPQARRDFMQVMTDRAAFYGITAKKVEPMTVKGDVVVIGGREYPKAIADKRTRLEERIQRDGFNQIIDAVAYSWFNRFVALRYMELHGYLEHGYRVLSHPEGKPFPEILEHAEHLDLPTLDRNTVIELKLAGNKENELYRQLLLAQCNALHASMPFLFEKINDETELLLPENLLNSDSLIRKLVDGIAEEDWEKVEIIGWLYQYYISEKKDEVIGSVVASEDIPAATQLFTPNWIVRYLVQNTLGRKWLATYPESSIRGQMEFYIEPAEQELEVQAKLKEITPESLNPEDITFLDPACGSGHILVEAYELFKAIYQERGYRTKDIPSLILQKNLFGFEIDERAAQLSMFALLMKARADDRRILNGKAQPNIVCFVESKGLNPADLVIAINQEIVGVGSGNIAQFDISELVELFEHAKTFGSLIQVPPAIANKLEVIEARLNSIEKNDDFTWRSLKVFSKVVRQAKALAQKYDIIDANPPFLGNKGMEDLIKIFSRNNYEKSKQDLFSQFIERNLYLSSGGGSLGFVTPFVWLFIASYQEFREWVLEKSFFSSLIQLEYNAFEPACVPVCAYVINKSSLSNYVGSFIKLSSFKGYEEQPLKVKHAIRNTDVEYHYKVQNSEFNKIPGKPFSFWVSKGIRDLFQNNKKALSLCTKITKGVFTGDNNKFIRFWFEVSSLNRNWVKYSKGGAVRKWYGNTVHKIYWQNGKGILSEFGGAGLGASKYFGKTHFVWSKLTSSDASFRHDNDDVFFDDCSPALVMEEPNYELLAYLNSKIAAMLLNLLNPTLNYQAGDIQKLPIPSIRNELERMEVISNTKELVCIHKDDWDSSEISIDFKGIQLNIKNTIEDLCCFLEHEKNNTFDYVKKLEEFNNNAFINELNLSSDFNKEVKDDKVTLFKFSNLEFVKNILSFFIGCIMGRYSLDKEGLIYAHSSNEGFDPSQYKSFPADDDGIVPLLNQDWGIPDDATERFVQFVSVAWAREHLGENLQFVAESLGGKPEEPAREVIRSYFTSGFFKHHLQMYKRRPIYWLFSSGKQKAFQALVYLHRYNESTLSRLRNEYVIPLLGKISWRIEQLEADKVQASSTSQRKKFQKEQDDLKKQQAELLSFDEKLKNYADQRIKLDLDDGVKVNYAKLGDLLAEVKAVTGGTEE